MCANIVIIPLLTTIFAFEITKHHLNSDNPCCGKEIFERDMNSICVPFHPFRSPL